MGLDRKTVLPHFMKAIKDINTSEMDMIELGSQNIDTDDDPSGKKFKDVKFRDEFKNRFKTWRTLDLCGGKGVELFDLSILTNEKKCADIITNYGTIEHIEKEEGQYNCWVNIHNMLRINGIIIHTLPCVGAWEGHCRWYYDFQFLEVFKEYGYKIIEMQKTWHDLILCAMIKTENVKFMSYEKFMGIVTFVGGAITKGNNPKGLI